MPIRRRNDNVDYDTTETGDYTPTGQPPPAPPVRGGTSNLPAPPQPGPGAPPPAPQGGYDRTQFRDQWMSSTGSLQDFIKQHPEFATGVTTGGNKGDIAYLPGGEIMDLQIAKGANGDNALHGWTGIGSMGPGGIPQYNPTPASGSGGSSYGSSAGGGSSSGGGDYDAMFKQLQKLYPDGMFNQDVVNRRTENAAENLRRFQKSQSSNDRAALAERGLLGSGPEQTAQNRLESNIGDQYSNAVSGIYADESQNADQRMMQALQTAAGLTADQARNAVDWYSAQTGRQGLDVQKMLGLGNIDLQRTLGLGNLALGNQHLGLDAQQLQWMMDHGDTQQILDTIQQLYGGAGTSAGGHR